MWILTVIPLVMAAFGWLSIRFGKKRGKQHAAKEESVPSEREEAALGSRNCSRADGAKDHHKAAFKAL